MPKAMLEDFSKLRDYDKTDFLLSGLKCNVTIEWVNLYTGINLRARPHAERAGYFTFGRDLPAHKIILNLEKVKFSPICVGDNRGFMFAKG